MPAAAGTLLDALFAILDRLDGNVIAISKTNLAAMAVALETPMPVRHPPPSADAVGR